MNLFPIALRAIAIPAILIASLPNRLQAAEETKSALLDDFGDPLPPGAIARIGTLRFHHGGERHSLAVSPDGKTLATGAIDPQDSSAIIWEAAIGKELSRFDNVGSFVAFSHDGKVLATSGKREDTRIRLWDVATGKLVREIEVTGADDAPVEGIGSIAFSPDGQTLAVETWWIKTGGKPEYPHYKAFRVLELATGAQRFSFSAPDDYGHGASALAFSPDGKNLAVIGGKSQSVYLVDSTTGKASTTLGTHASACAFSANGRFLAVADYRQVQLIDMSNHKVVRTFSDFQGRYGHLPGPIALSPDGGLLVAGGDYHEPLRVYDTSTGRRIFEVPKYLNERSSAVAFSPDGDSVIATVGPKVRIWNIGAGTESMLSSTPRVSISCSEFSPDSSMLAVCNHYRGVRIYDVASHNVLHECGGEEYVRTVSFSPDGDTLVTAGKTLRLWDSRTGKEIRTLLAEPDIVDRAKLGQSCAEFLPNVNQLVSGGYAGIIRVWNAESGAEVRRFQQPFNVDHHTDPVRGMAIFSDGKRVATIAHNVYVWSLANGELLETFDGRNQYGRAGCPIAISPDGRRLAFETSRQTKARSIEQGVLIQEVDGEKTARFINEPTDHRSTLWEVAVAFSPDGRILATGGAHKSVRLWETANGKQLIRLDGHADQVTYLDFSPDGKTLASASADGTILFWDVASVN